MKLLIAIIFFVLIISDLTLTSCKVTEKSIPGVYQTDDSIKLQLNLKDDKTFDLGVADSGQRSPTSGDHLKELKTGMWQLEGKSLKLILDNSALIDDSITRFTNISCFNFWDKDGAPVSIRYILIPESKLKPHFGNSLYFFSQDFKSTDTLTFYFNGYPPFHFPGSVPSTIGNNMHKVTMQLPDRNTITQIKMKARKNRFDISPAVPPVLDADKIRFRRINKHEGRNK